MEQFSGSKSLPSVPGLIQFQVEVNKNVFFFFITVFRIFKFGVLPPPIQCNHKEGPSTLWKSKTIGSSVYGIITTWNQITELAGLQNDVECFISRQWKYTIAVSAKRTVFLWIITMLKLTFLWMISGDGYAAVLIKSWDSLIFLQI